MGRFLILTFLFSLHVSVETNAQCSYNLINLNHINCHDDNTGEISISITNPNATFWWVLPNGVTSTSLILSNLYAGDYVLNIVENMVPGDTNSSEICSLIDTISVEQTIQLTASFTLHNMCSPLDSADITTDIYGGTPPYTTLWIQTGDTARNASNLPPSLTPYALNITDLNGCERKQYLTINPVVHMQTFMSSEGLICKDDNSGMVRVFVENGTPPYTFEWNNDILQIHDESSQIHNLEPGTYSVNIQDAMGCVISDSLEIMTNPEICIQVYKAFSPNEDGVNDFWNIENIHLYPEALIEVYDRLGNRVYRKRNYVNAKNVAFNGMLNDKRLPSGVYYFVIDLQNNDKVFKGTLTIVR